MQINTNLESLNAQRSYARSSADLAVHVQRLSSGLRVNSASDDAAGQAIGDRRSTACIGRRKISMRAFHSCRSPTAQPAS
jgi:flagellin